MTMDSPLNLTLFIELGLLMLFAFSGAVLTKRFGQSAMIGYIVAGIVIGPYVLGSYIGFTEPLPLILSSGSIVQGYKLPQITISFFAQIGLILLLFFAGLKFSFSKLRRTGKGVTGIITRVDIALNMFVGFAIGTYLGWSLIDSIFLAVIIAMSSLVISLRLIEELKMEDRIETDILVSLLVVEDFISIILLAIISGIMISSGQQGMQTMLFTFLGIGVLFAFFIILSFVFIPANIHRFENIRNREYLILLVLGVVFLSSALAEFFNIAGMIGAFLVGMAFAETELSNTIEREVSAVKDAFVAVFFVWFGMMINPVMFKDVIPLLIISVPLVLANEILFLSAMAYFTGISRRGAVFIGTGTMGRSEEAIIFASVGSSSMKVNASGVAQPILQNSSSIINPFAGAFCFIMSYLCGLFMKASNRIADFFERKLPCWIKFSSGLLRVVIADAILERKKKGHGWRAIAMILYVSYTIILIGFTPVGFDTRFSLSPSLENIHLLLYFLLPIIALVSCLALNDYFSTARIKTRLRIGHESGLTVKTFALSVVSGAGVSALFAIAIWPFHWLLSPVVLLIYTLIFLVELNLIYRRLFRVIEPFIRHEKAPP